MINDSTWMILEVRKPFVTRSQPIKYQFSGLKSPKFLIKIPLIIQFDHYLSPLQGGILMVFNPSKPLELSGELSRGARPVTTFRRSRPCRSCSSGRRSCLAAASSGEPSPSRRSSSGMHLGGWGWRDGGMEDGCLYYVYTKFINVH